MKLHLPKLLCAAVMAACSYSIQAATLTSTTDADGNTLWDVGVAVEAVKPYTNATTYDGDITLDANDKLGVFNEKKELITSFGSIKGTADTKQSDLTKYTYTTTGTITNNLHINGTLTLTGDSKACLGGQFRTSYGANKGDYDEYTGLEADKVVVQDNAHLYSVKARIKTLQIDGGRVDLRTGFTSGNSSLSVSGKDSKQAQILNRLELNGGMLVMGSQNASSSQWHQTFAGEIEQSNASKMIVYGNTILQSNLKIKQHGGSMDMCSSNGKIQLLGTTVIEQDGSGTMKLGQLYAKAKRTVSISQSGSGTIELLNGIDFSDRIGTISIAQKDTVDEITGQVTASTGNINLKGDFSDANISIQQTACEATANLSGTINLAGESVINGTLNILSGKVTANGTTTVTGTIDVKANASLTLNGIVNVEGKGTILGNMILGNTTTLNFETTANMAISSTLSLTEGNSMSFHIDTVTDEDGFMQMSESGDLNFTAGTLSLNLTDVAKQEMVAGATLEGTEFHLTLIDNLSAADVAELEGVINSSLLLEEYLEELPLTLSRAVAPTVTLEAQGLLLENNQLKAVVVATSHNVPEPTTATLSLLALAGLAARRRRR